MRCPSEGGESIEYTEAYIATLSDAAHIRHRPGMYIGSTDSSGLHWMLLGLVRGSLAEAVIGHGDSVRVTLYADGSAQVEDNGTVPANEPHQGNLTVKQLLTTIYSTGKWGTVPAGREWFEYAVANALSDEMVVLVREPGRACEHTFLRGVRHEVLQSDSPDNDRGLTVQFWSDPDVFGAAAFDPNLIRERLQQYAFLNSGIQFVFSDEVNGTREEFEYAEGLTGYVRLLNAERTPLHPGVIAIEAEEEGVYFEVALQWCDGADELRMSFANDWHTRDGGTHINGVLAAVRRAVGNLVQHQPKGKRVTSDDIREGLTAVVAVRLEQPFFAGATRTQLANPEVERIVAKSVSNYLHSYFAENPEVAEAIVRHALQARDVREAARAAREQLRKRK